jgi:hypothetical protein
MYYCLTLSEKTGHVNLGQGGDSVISFLEIYRDDMRLVFENDGITVKSVIDTEGNTCSDIAGKIKVWCFNNGSTHAVVPNNYSNNSLTAAYNVMPDWTSSYSMSGLVFAIVRIDYDATNDLKSLGTFKFKLQNTMVQPGDCLYDYMTNTRYGAAIPAGDILDE